MLPLTAGNAELQLDYQKAPGIIALHFEDGKVCWDGVYAQLARGVHPWAATPEGRELVSYLYEEYLQFPLSMYSGGEFAKMCKDMEDQLRRCYQAIADADHTVSVFKPRYDCALKSQSSIF